MGILAGVSVGRAATNAGRECTMLLSEFPHGTCTKHDPFHAYNVFVEALVPQVWWIAEDTLEFWAVSLH
jgi:hypothetical protein